MDMTAILATFSVLALAGIAAGLMKRKLFGSLKSFAVIGVAAIAVGLVFDWLGVSAFLGAAGLVALYVAMKYLKLGPFSAYG